ncbi:MAG TPA: M42 family peptidase [bacterium (Candidatus Stahlbacteria)]|nr:M42 family peptidase [Candidatus Stahlbacteria bacterium]
MMEMLSRLSETFGPSGWEGEVRELIGRMISFPAEKRVDTLGNLIVHKPGKGKKLLLAAHMDEVGLMVREIDNNGFIRFSLLGKVVTTTLPGSKVRFQDGTGGVVGYEHTNNHSSKPDVNKLYIDIGMDSKGVEKKIKVGDVAVFDTQFRRNGDRIFGKAFDDRVGCYILIRLINEITNSPWDCYFVFTVQEEVGLRGGRTAGYGIEPDCAISVDVTGSGDTPKGEEVPMKLGGGVAIKIRDSRMISTSLIRNRLVEIAEMKKVKYQYEVIERGTTDGAAIQLIRSGVLTGAVSIPTRYIHTGCEVCDIQDIVAATYLLKGFLEREL